MLSGNDGLSVTGLTLFQAINGIFEIKDILLVGQPSKEFKFKIFASVIDSSTILKFKPNLIKDTISI